MAKEFPDKLNLIAGVGGNLNVNGVVLAISKWQVQEIYRNVKVTNSSSPYGFDTFRRVGFGATFTVDVPWDYTNEPAVLMKSNEGVTVTFHLGDQSSYADGMGRYLVGEALIDTVDIVTDATGVDIIRAVVKGTINGVLSGNF